MAFVSLYFVIAITLFIVCMFIDGAEDPFTCVAFGMLWPITIIATIIFLICDWNKEKEKEKKVMADAKRCDRCGKYYVQGEKKYKIRDKRITRINACSFYTDSVIGWDLCDDCVEAFDKFMRMEDGAECLKE